MTHYILDVAVGDEVVVTLDNGARYEVAGDDAPTAALWYGSQQARVIPSRDKIFPVRLSNADLDQRVKARRLVEEDGKTDG